MRPEDRLGVRALGGGAVRDDHDLPPERLHAGEKRGGARERDRLAPGAPGRPARGVEGQAGPRPLELVERVVEHRLVGVEDDGPGAGSARRRLALDVGGGRAVDLPEERAVLGRVAHPADRLGGAEPLRGRRGGGDGCRGGLRRHGGGRAAAARAHGEDEGQGPARGHRDRSRSVLRAQSINEPSRAAATHKGGTARPQATGCERSPIHSGVTGARRCGAARPTGNGL